MTPFTALPKGRYVLFCFLAAACTVAGICHIGPAWGQYDILQGNSHQPKQFLLVLAGHAGKTNFTGSEAVLTLSYPPPTSINPLQVIIHGFPAENSNNTFFWNSEESTMTVAGGEIFSTIKNSYLKQKDSHFFYLSPVFFENRAFLTQQESQGRKLAVKTALPTRVRAIAGNLKLSVQSTHVTGSVWIKGYDSVECAYTEYAARFTGRQTSHLEPTKDRKFKQE